MYTRVAPRQDGILVIGDSKVLDGSPLWTIGNPEESSLSNFWSTLDQSENANASISHTVDVTVDAMIPTFQLSALDGSVAESVGDEVGSELFQITYSSNTSIADRVDKFNIHVDVASLIDGSQYQPEALSFAGSEEIFSLNGWSSTSDAANALFQPLYTGSPIDPTGPSFGPETFTDFAADAKGGAGGKPGGGGSGGGGGGGGGSGLLTTYTSGDPSVPDTNEFNIQINFSGSWTAKQQAVVIWAADTWSQIITGDINDDYDLNGILVDDIVISMSTGRIDGNGNPLFGNVLAQTGDIVVRDPGAIDEWLPLTASIKLDSTDLKNSAFADAWDDIIFHELGHALGFIGAIFDQLGLVDGFNFIGTNAMAAYGGLVPLEDGGGNGTIGSHWDEAAFAPNGLLMSNEVMTGYFVPGEQTYLSDTTVGALADLGYTVQDPSAGTYLSIDSHLLIA